MALDLGLCCTPSIGAEMSHFSRVSAEVSATLSAPDRPKEGLSSTAKAVEDRVREAATKDRNAEWQRVNSYLADVLKDAHVLYSKLARLQGDFAGTESTQLEKISESVLDIGEELSRFMKDFHTGRADMVGDTAFGGGEAAGPPPGTPPPAIPSEFSGGEAPPEGGEPSGEEFEKEIKDEEEEEFSEFEEEEGEAEGKGSEAA